MKLQKMALALFAVALVAGTSGEVHSLNPIKYMFSKTYRQQRASLSSARKELKAANASQHAQNLRALAHTINSPGALGVNRLDAYKNHHAELAAQYAAQHAKLSKHSPDGMSYETKKLHTDQLKYLETMRQHHEKESQKKVDTLWDALKTNIRSKTLNKSVADTLEAQAKKLEKNAVEKPEKHLSAITIHGMQALDEAQKHTTHDEHMANRVEAQLQFHANKSAKELTDAADLARSAAQRAQDAQSSQTLGEHALQANAAEARFQTRLAEELEAAAKKATHQEPSPEKNAANVEQRTAMQQREKEHEQTLADYRARKAAEAAAFQQLHENNRDAAAASFKQQYPNPTQDTVAMLKKKLGTTQAELQASTLNTEGSGDRKPDVIKQEISTLTHHLDLAQQAAPQGEEKPAPQRIVGDVQREFAARKAAATLEKQRREQDAAASSN